MKRFFYKNSLLFQLFFIVILSANAQQTYHLTHKLSDEERALMQTREYKFNETPAPTGDIRAIAEWESMEGAIVAYDGGFGIPLSMISAVSQDVTLYVFVAGAAEENTVTNTFQSNGVNLSNVVFIHQDPNSWWARDYSPWPIVINEETVAMVDFPYNRPRPNDDNVPFIMGGELGVDVYGMNVTHAGGNFMCDGYGTAVSTDLVYEENTSMTPAQIDAKFQNYLGIDNYFVTNDPQDDYIKHVDCWGKFLDVDKILITQVPESDYRYEDYEAIANFFANQNCSWGYPYEVIRVQAADFNSSDINPYTNSFIINNKVYVPQSGSNLDDDALAVYEEAMPGYEIVGVYSTGWYNTDAVHCRIHGVANRQMLHIKHTPYNGLVDYQSAFDIEAKVYTYGSDVNLASGYPKLHYSINDGEWQTVDMTLSSGNTYTAQITGISETDTTKYYIEAKNTNNTESKLPVMGSEDPFVFHHNTTSDVSDVTFDNAINLYPNVNNGNFDLTTPYNTGRMTIFGADGKLLYQTNITDTETHIMSGINNSGLYFVKIEQEGYQTFRKIIIK
ncbi:MAG: hypothetical protein CR968_05630 [Flavobacteriia bacterium]|nr:MAG: hypothetical protein CR968_05630 [Flavobacteriia bacterium]